MVDKVKGGVKRGCVHFDTPSFIFVYSQTAYSPNRSQNAFKIILQSHQITQNNRFFR